MTTLNAVGEETAESFTTSFYSNISELSTRSMEATSDTDLEVIRETLQEIRQLCSYGGQWWVGYEMRKAQQALLQAEQDVDTATRRIHPRRKFKFSRRGTKKVSSKMQDNLDTTTAQELKLPTTGSVEVSASMVKDGVIELNDVIDRDINLNALSNTTVLINDRVGAIRVLDASNCKIVAVNVSGSVYVTNATNCEMWVKCRQMRMHNSSKCILWVDIEGGVIIETCKEMQFGPIELEGKMGRGWQLVKDFAWLRKPEEQSPNWSQIEERCWTRGILHMKEGKIHFN